MNLRRVTATAKQLTWVILAAGAMTVSAAERFYRYVNEEGVTVMDSKIPPRYVKNGYQIVTPSGRVLEEVPPAPSREEAAKRAAERKRQAKMAKLDEYLLRRYSSIADIEAAKDRKMADFDASMSVLRGNAASIEARIENVQHRAADIERSGRAVPKVLLKNLEKLEAELSKAKKQIQQRREEKKELKKRFAKEKERFATIKSES